jgi:Peptidase family M23
METTHMRTCLVFRPRLLQLEELILPAPWPLAPTDSPDHEIYNNYGEYLEESGGIHSQEGMDIRAAGGTDVFAIEAGEVVSVSAVGTPAVNGYIVVKSGDHGWNYIHVNPGNNPRTGARWDTGPNRDVQVGDLLGVVGAQPNTYPDHLHIDRTSSAFDPRSGRGPTMSTEPNDRSGAKWTGGQKMLLVAVGAGCSLIWILSLSSPIPTGIENREKAVPFLKELVPDRAVSPDNATAPVAVVFHLIRHGEPEVARRAIEFAADQGFGYAAPYVIERLGSGDPKLEAAAQDFLRKVAGADYGPDAAAWRAWWRDPPRRLLGQPQVGQHKFALAVPIACAIAGAVSLVIAWRTGRSGFTRFGGGVLFGTWFMSFGTAATRLVGSPNTCDFGPDRITFYASHGAVVGLEDARAGGTLLLLGLMAAFLGVPALIAVVYAIIYGRLEKPCEQSAEGDRHDAPR